MAVASSQPSTGRLVGKSHLNIITTTAEQQQVKRKDQGGLLYVDIFARRIDHGLDNLDRKPAVETRFAGSV